MEILKILIKISTDLPLLQILEGIDGLVEEAAITREIMIDMRDIPSLIATTIEVAGKIYFFR